jgi:hypothetical protein
VGKLQKKLLIITISFFLFSFNIHSQVFPRQDSINFKNDLEKLLSKYGLQSAGYQINVQSNNQRGGQTAFTITNNNYVTYNVGIIPRKLADNDKINLLNRLNKMLLENNLPTNTLIEFGYIMGDVENQSFAKEVAGFLMSKGYNVDRALKSTMGVEGDGFKLILTEKHIFINVGSSLNNDRP